MTAPNPDRPNTDRPDPALPRPENLLANLPTAVPEELVTILAENRHVRIERIVSTGHASPEGFWYDQEEHEWVLLLQGAATLRFEDGREVSLKPGDHLLIPAHQKHRVAWTLRQEPTVWLAVFFWGVRCLPMLDNRGSSCIVFRLGREVRGGDEAKQGVV